MAASLNKPIEEEEEAPNTGCLDCNRYEVNAARQISVFIMFI